MNAMSKTLVKMPQLKCPAREKGDDVLKKGGVHELWRIDKLKSMTV